jgi:CheY-like chemotaxis protein
MKNLIMIVDDNKDFIFNLELLLTSHNLDVVSALQGKEALKLLETMERLPDLIISDILMPEMNGYDFFTKISSNQKFNQIPFIFLTARTSPEEIEYGKKLGVDEYIIKPFSEDSLIVSINNKLIIRRH